MATHRWSQLTNLISSATPRQKMKVGLVTLGLLLLFGLMSFGYFKPNLEQAMQLSAADPKAKNLKAVSVGQNADFMGKVVEQHRTQTQQGVELQRLKDESRKTRIELQQALSQTQQKPSLSQNQVQQMIVQALAQARNGPTGSTAAPVVTPKPVVLTNTFEPPDLPAGKTPSPQLPNGPESEPPAQAVPIPAGGTAEGLALNGFLAQSGGETESVTVELITDLTGPNQAIIPMKGCRVVSDCKAQDIIARGRCEISVVTCTLPGNRLIDLQVSGWLTAGDNVNSEFGTVIWNDTELLKRMGAATLPGILSELLDLTDTTIDATSGLGVVTTDTSSPLSDIARELSDLLLDRVRMFIFPIVYVERNQRVNVYIRETAYAIGTSPRDWVYHTVAPTDHPYN